MDVFQVVLDEIGWDGSFDVSKFCKSGGSLIRLDVAPDVLRSEPGSKYCNDIAMSALLMTSDLI